MAANFTRSSSGMSSCSASSSTRASNSTHDSSRLSKSRGSRSSGSAGSGGSSAGAGRGALADDRRLLGHVVADGEGTAAAAAAPSPSREGDLVTSRTGRSRIAKSRRARKPSRSSFAPQLHEALEEQRAAALQVRRRAVCSPRQAGAFVRAGGHRGVEVVGAAPAARRASSASAAAQRLGERAHARKLHVAVVQLAEQVLELPRALRRGARRTGRSTARPPISRM